MRILVQKIATGEYYASPGQWNLDPAAALNFATGKRAHEFCASQQEFRLRIVLKFTTKQLQDIALPVQTRPRFTGE